MGRIIGIGDIHGCYYTLAELIERLDIKKDDTIIFLGDYIDRGKNSYNVVDYILKLEKELGKEKCICLLGNHEDMFLNDKDLWLYNGGRKTLRSYYKNRKINRLYNSHKSWFKNLRLYYEIDRYIFVHAGLPKEKIEDNTKEEMIWDRTHMNLDINRNKTIIFGHTPTNGMYEITQNGDINIDTGCVFGQNLTAIIIENNIIEFLSVVTNPLDI